jgi:hypothetical protein
VVVLNPEIPLLGLLPNRVSDLTTNPNEGQFSCLNDIRQEGLDEHVLLANQACPKFFEPVIGARCTPPFFEVDAVRVDRGACDGGFDDDLSPPMFLGHALQPS